MEKIKEGKLVRAYKKVEEIKKFYWFLGAAVLVSLLFFGMAYFLTQVGAPSFVIWMFLSMPLVFGVVLLIEYLRVFDRNPFFGKDWKERKLQQFLEEERANEEYRR